MERRPSDQGQWEAVTITGLSPAIRGQRGQREEGARRPLTAQVGGIEAPGVHGGLRERVPSRESAPQRECPECLDSWRPGQDRGRGLPTAGAVLAPAGSAGKSVSSPICSSFPPSSRTSPHRGLPSQRCEPSAFPGTRGPADQGSVSPASGWRSSRLGASEGLQTLSVPGGQGLILQLHQAWQEEPYQGCRGNGPQTDPDRLSEVPPPRPTEEEEALSPGATGLPSCPHRGLTPPASPWAWLCRATAGRRDSAVPSLELASCGGGELTQRKERGATLLRPGLRRGDVASCETGGGSLLGSDI